eukprot:1316559-Rhodomonas_salina.2
MGGQVGFNMSEWMAPLTSDTRDHRCAVTLAAKPATARGVWTQGVLELTCAELCADTPGAVS